MIYTKRIIKLVLSAICILFLYILYLLASTSQYWYTMTFLYYYMNHNTFQKIEDIILLSSQEKDLEEVVEELNDKYSKYVFEEINNWKNIEIKRLYKELGWNDKYIIITYSLNWSLFSYNNSSKISKRLSWNRRYRSDVNWRQSDDF